MRGGSPEANQALPDVKTTPNATGGQEGTARMLYCQKCFHELPDGTVFCDACGTSLLQEAPLPPPSTPEQLKVTPSRLPRTDLTPATPPSAQGARGSALGAQHAGTAQAPRIGTRIRLRLANGKAFDLAGRPNYLIGRRDPEQERAPDVDLTDWNGAAYGVSRRHAMIHQTPDGFAIEDLHSLNETIRNGYRLMPGQQYPLADGDELRLGSITVLVVIT
jgi:hypothetical protein